MACSFLLAAAGQRVEEVNRVPAVDLALRQGVIDLIKVSLQSQNEIRDDVDGAVAFTETFVHMVTYSPSRALVATRPGSGTHIALVGSPQSS